MITPCDAKSWNRLFQPLSCLLYHVSLKDPTSLYSLASRLVFLALHCLRKRFAPVHKKSTNMVCNSAGAQTGKHLLPSAKLTLAGLGLGLLQYMYASQIIHCQQILSGVGVTVMHCRANAPRSNPTCHL